MSRTESVQPQLDRIQRGALVAAVVGLALCVLGLFFDRAQFFQSYLFAYLFWGGLALGSFSVMMLQHVSGGGWGLVIQRLVEAGARTLPLVALLFVPVVFGMYYLYEWTHADVVAEDAALQHKTPYLNVPFFIARAAIYFAIWIALMFVLTRWTSEQDRTGDPHLTNRLKMVSRLGLLVYFITMTFAAFDWGMSLEPHWFSTIYGILFVVNQALFSLAFAVAVIAVLANRDPLSDVVTPARFNDLGNLLLAFVILWAYVSFSQYLIIWSANIPEEATWYLRRQAGGWEWVILFLIIFHFTLPFLLLMARQNKRKARVLGAIASTIIVAHFVNLFWMITPAFHATGIHVHWLDLAAVLGIGGIWIAAFIWQLKARPLVPVHDPRLQEAVAHGH